MKAWTFEEEILPNLSQGLLVLQFLVTGITNRLFLFRILVCFKRECHAVQSFVVL